MIGVGLRTGRCKRGEAIQSGTDASFAKDVTQSLQHGNHLLSGPNCPRWDGDNTVDATGAESAQKGRVLGVRSLPHDSKRGLSGVVPVPVRPYDDQLRLSSHDGPDRISLSEGPVFRTVAV